MDAEGPNFEGCNSTVPIAEPKVCGFPKDRGSGKNYTMFWFFDMEYGGCSRYFLTPIDKVENILKGSLDSIPSPSTSVKIQIMGGKVCLRCKGKTLLGIVNKLLKANVC
jgi:hypothetical protein